MFYTTGLLYIHVPRTGGTFLTSALVRRGLATRSVVPGVDGHDSIRDVPERFRDVFSFATVRDPWSWYSSLNAHFRHGSSLDGFLHQYFDGRSVGFSDSVVEMCRPGGNVTVRQPNLRLPGGKRPLPDLKFRLKRSGYGLWSYVILSLLCVEEYETIPHARSLVPLSEVIWGVDAVVDTAQIRSGACAILRASQAPFDESVLNEIMNSSPKNASAGFTGVMPDGTPDRGMYDAAAIDAVMTHDGPMMRFLGMDRPVGDMHRPAIRLLEKA